ncbi:MULTISPECIES: 1-phosphofructokinase [unclassified Agarivorans]|uniref:1-phosphofructokinase n=1 Tax=unclassified Agarivorans TaxID=2636026 RepID=UPI003D7D9D5D
MSQAKAVLCITLNPALDLTGSLENMTVGSVNNVTEANLHPAGKGVNVAKVLADLGAQVCVSGFLGKDNAAAFECLFEQSQIRDEFIRVAGETRTNVKMVEASGQVTDLNFPGFSVDAADLLAFEQSLEQLCEQYSHVVFAGSLAKGIELSDFEAWINLAKSKGCTVLIDTSGAALNTAIATAPNMVKPNQDELEDWCGTALNSIDKLKEKGQELADLGIEHVLISRGEHGSLWLNQNHWMQATPPSMNVVSTVGAGDTFVASFCWGLLNQSSAKELLRFASAMSSLAVSQTNVGLPSQEALDSVLQQTTITQM